MAQQDESSEYTSGSESEEEQFPSRVLLKPVFVKKQDRETILEQERKEKEAAEAEKKRQALLEEKKKESAEMVFEQLRKEMEEAQQALEDVGLDDTDGINEAEEFEAWKLRELLRIKRDREQREQHLVDLEDIERRRNLSDSQVAEENKQDGTLGVEKEKMKFLQKYYHKGAFFTDDGAVGEALKKTNSLAPTLEDRADKSVLPSVLQVKNFGKAGRTKYTHLVDQDTTGLDTAWSKPENISESTLKKMGGLKSGFTKPPSKKPKLN